MVKKLLGLMTAGITTASLCGVSYAATTPRPAHAMYSKAIFLENSDMLDVHESLSRPYGFIYQNTWYMPIYYLQTALQKLGIHSTWDGTNWRITTPSFMSVDTSSITVGSGNKNIYINGQLVKKVVGVADIDPSSGKQTMFMPVWYLMQILKAMNVDSDWDGTVWTLKTDNNIVDAQPLELVQLVDTALPTSASELQDSSGLLNLDQSLEGLGYVTQKFVQDDTSGTGNTGRHTWIQQASTTAGVSGIYPSADWNVVKEDHISDTEVRIQIQKVEVVEYQSGKKGTVFEDWTWDVVQDPQSGLWQVNSVTENTGTELPAPEQPSQQQ